MSRLRKFAQRIRHAPGLERAEGLWKVLRKPYQKLLNAGGRGVLIRVGGKAEVRMPAEFAGGSWETYEPETVEIFKRWVQDHPDGLVLDVGSSLGIFSAVALFAQSTASVIAFDPDLSSLAAARRLCQYASGARLQLANCFVTDVASDTNLLEEAAALTEEALAKSDVRGDVGTTRYICLNDATRTSIPTYRLDDLLADRMSSDRPLLIKCDVEGAELNVLHGGEKLLRRMRPDLVLSIHPAALPNYGHSKTDVETFLNDLNYIIKVIGIDHEEHWWCECRL